MEIRKILVVIIKRAILSVKRFSQASDTVQWGAPYFVYPLFCNVPLILYDFRFLKLQNKGNILCIQDSDSKILRF